MKKISLSAFVALAFTTLAAQNVGIGTTLPQARLHVADSSVLFTAASPNPFPYSLAPTSGEGARMMWYAGKSAFRVGMVAYNDVFEDGSKFWDTDSIGEYSFASGYNTKAKGIYSTAMGFHTTAENFSTCIGYVSRARGAWATAIGTFARAEANYATVIGRGTASGYGSFATGFDSWAAADYASATGYRTKASGVISTAMGDNTVARAYGSLSIGRFNDSISTSNTNSWVATDPLLYIGNGLDNANRSNAAVIFKNGNVDVNGYTQLGKTSEAAPSVKMKKLAGVSAAAQNTWVNIPHGLTQSKIIAVNILMNIPGFVNVPPAYTYHVGYEYQYQVSSANIVVINTDGNSANILNKSFTILITYEE
jgi:hypothetical protein